ncbi:MAG TPA: MBL fold metallo-hydrolase, partial [Candidatus Limnocylindria bacterium]|nr:MBL fold metallo-hydrolase [Candidatus Limnocylindria bacterium]
EVTGSRYLVESEGVKLLVDCGLFQGQGLAKHNWDPFPVDPKTIDAIVITHAHIDHTGYIPLLVKNGFKGSIYCSPATYALCRLLLIDSGSVQESNARNREEHGNSDLPPDPLYTIEDAQNALTFFQAADYGTPIKISASVEVTLIRSFHILGSSFVVVSDGKQKLSFSGDLGRPQQLIMKDPPAIGTTDYLVLESTYGDREHGKGDPIEALGQAIVDGIKKGGMVIIPAFAVERTQLILYCLYQLKKQKTIPQNIPIFLDSPLAIGVTDLFCKFPDEHTLSVSECKEIFGQFIPTRTVDESKRLNSLSGQAIIIAGSGMADGGRVVHHLRHTLSDAKNTIIFVGYQAHGTTGDILVGGAKKIKIQDFWYEVHATVTNVNIFSAHADYNEVLLWLGHFQKPPKKVFLTHGDVESAASLKKKIEERFGWTVVIPKYLDSFPLD